MAVAFVPSREPSVASSWEVTPSVNVAKFGDGYEQRAQNGANPIAYAARLVWAGIPISDAKAIEADANTGLGFTARLYTLSGDVQRQWVFEKVSGAYSERLIADLTIEMREVFDL